MQQVDSYGPILYRTLHECISRGAPNHSAREPRAHLVTNGILQNVDIFAIPGFIW